MKVMGLCVYCKRPAKHTCHLCGALICEVHTDPFKKVCTACAKGRKTS